MTDFPLCLCVSVVDFGQRHAAQRRAFTTNSIRRTVVEE